MTQVDKKAQMRGSLKDNGLKLDQKIAAAARLSERDRKSGTPKATFCLYAEDEFRLSKLEMLQLKSGHRPNKSQLVRAGLAALDKLSAEEVLKILVEVPPHPLGRPRQP